MTHYKRFNKSEIFGCKENGSYEDEEMVHGHINEFVLGFHYVIIVKHVNTNNFYMRLFKALHGAPCMSL